jgi:hypothetical protein
MVKIMLLEIPFFLIVTFYDKPHFLETESASYSYLCFWCLIIWSHFLAVPVAVWIMKFILISLEIYCHDTKLFQFHWVTRSVYWLVVTSPAGPRPIRVPPMLACSGVKPSSSFGIPYCCSFPSYVWSRSSCALHTLASSYCRSWRAAFFRHSSSCNVWVPGGYASFADRIVLNVFWLRI